MSTLANGNGLGFDPIPIMEEADDAGRVADMLAEAQALRAIRDRRVAELNGPPPGRLTQPQTNIPDVLRQLARPLGSPRAVSPSPPIGTPRGRPPSSLRIERHDWPDPYESGAAVRVPVPSAPLPPAPPTGPGATGGEEARLWSRINASAAEIAARSQPQFEDAPTDEAKLAIVNKARAEYGLPPTVELGRRATAADVAGKLATPRGAAGLVPFVSAGLEGKDLYDVYAAARNVENGQASRADLETLADFQEESLRQLRGYTIGGKAASIVADAIPFIGEFVASGGVAGLVRAGGRKVAGRFASDAIKRATIAAAKKGASEAVQAGARTGIRAGAGAVSRAAGEAALRLPTFIPRIANDALRAITPNYVLTKDDADSLTAWSSNEPQDFVPALRDALAGNYIEIASELAGGGLVQFGKGALSATAKRLPGIRVAAERLPAFVTRAKTGVLTELTRRFPDQIPTLAAAARFAQRAGYHGVLGEIGEERLAQVLRWAAREGQQVAGLESRLEPGPIPGWDDLAAEFAAFAAVGTGVAGAGAAASLAPAALSGLRKATKRRSEGRSDGATQRRSDEGTEGLELGAEEVPALSQKGTIDEEQALRSGPGTSGQAEGQREVEAQGQAEIETEAPKAVAAVDSGVLTGTPVPGVAGVLTGFGVEQIPSGQWQVVGPTGAAVATFASREPAELLARASRQAAQAEQQLAPAEVPATRPSPSGAIPPPPVPLPPPPQAPPAGPRARAAKLDNTAQGPVPAFRVRRLRNKTLVVTFDANPPYEVRTRLQELGAFLNKKLGGYLLPKRYNPEQIEAVIQNRPMPQALPGQEVPTPSKIAGKVIKPDPEDVTQSSAYVNAITPEQAAKLLDTKEDKALVLQALTSRGYTFGVDPKGRGRKGVKGADYYLHPSRDWRWIDAGSELRREVQDPQGKWVPSPTAKKLTFKRFAATIRPKLQEATKRRSDVATKGGRSDAATQRRSDEGTGKGSLAIAKGTTGSVAETKKPKPETNRPKAETPAERTPSHVAKAGKAQREPRAKKEATKRRSDEGKKGKAKTTETQVRVEEAAPIEPAQTRRTGIVRKLPAKPEKLPTPKKEWEELADLRRAAEMLGKARVTKNDRQVWGQRKSFGMRLLRDWGYEPGYLQRLARGWEPMPTLEQVEASRKEATERRSDEGEKKRRSDGATERRRDKGPTVTLEPGRDYARDLDRYRLRMGYTSKTPRSTLMADPLYMSLEEADEAARRKETLNNPKAREAKASTRKAAQEQAAQGQFTRESIVYVSLHQAPQPVRDAIQTRAKELLRDTRAGDVAKALQRIIDNLSSDRGAEVEHQKDRILGHVLGEVDTRTLPERQWGVPKAEPDAAVTLILEPDGQKRRLWVADAMVLAAKPPKSIPPVGQREMGEQLFAAAGNQLRGESGTGLIPDGREIAKLIEHWASLADAAAGAGPAAGPVPVVQKTPDPPKVRGALNESDVESLTSGAVVGATTPELERVKLKAAFRHVETGEVFPSKGEGPGALEHNLQDVPEAYQVRRIDERVVAVDPALEAGFVDEAGGWVQPGDAWQYVAKRRTMASLIRDAFPVQSATRDEDAFDEGNQNHRTVLAQWLDAFAAVEEAKAGLEGGLTLSDALERMKEASEGYEKLWGKLPTQIGRGSTQFQAMTMLREKVNQADIGRLLGADGTLEDELEFGPGSAELSETDRQELHSRNEPCA